MAGCEVSAHAISVRFGSLTAVSEFEHAFLSGRWTHIIGPNGAGKSTILKVLCGLCAPASGHVDVDGVDLSTWTYEERARNIAYVPQRIAHFPALTVLDFVCQGRFAWCRQETSEECRQKAWCSLYELGLEAYAARRLDELSGGEQQLCVLASAVAQNARVILLDEPTSSLDIGHSERFCQAVRALVGRGVTAISVTHDLSLASAYADETVLMCSGRCLWHGVGMPPSKQLSVAFGLPDSFFEKSLREHACDEMHSRVQAIEKTPQGVIGHRKVLVGVVIFVAVLLISPWFGATWSVPWDRVDIFWEIRVPRVLWGGIAGAVLSGAGAILQAMFQNPLATPYTLGIASGASFGAMAAIALGIGGLAGLPLCACFGGLISLAAVLLFSRRRGLESSWYSLMAGVAISMFCSAGILVIQAFSEPLTAHQMMRWQMGGLDVVGYLGFVSVPVIVLSCVCLFGLARSLDLLSVDAALAETRGVNVARTRLLALISTGVMTSIVVSVCGPIGFVGLLVPNGVRKMCGASLSGVLPMSMLLGGAILMTADVISRLLERVAWISVGVVMAVIGAPVFIYLLVGSVKKNP